MVAFSPPQPRLFMVSNKRVSSFLSYFHFFQKSVEGRLLPWTRLTISQNWASSHLLIVYSQGVWVTVKNLHGRCPWTREVWDQFSASPMAGNCLSTTIKARAWAHFHRNGVSARMRQTTMNASLSYTMVQRLPRWNGSNLDQRVALEPRMRRLQQTVNMAAEKEPG